MNYTLLLTNRRIIYPYNNLDMIGDIGLVGDRIGFHKDKKVIDVSNKWIVLGIIDPHIHVSSWIGGYPGLKMMAREGIITALDMAGPSSTVFNNVLAYGSGMNIAYINAFREDKDNEGSDSFTDEKIKQKIIDSMGKGALGIKLLGGHYPQSPEITGKIIRFAAEQGAYSAFHAGSTVTGSNLDGLVYWKYKQEN